MEKQADDKKITWLTKQYLRVTKIIDIRRVCLHLFKLGKYIYFKKLTFSLKIFLFVNIFLHVNVHSVVKRGCTHSAPYMGILYEIYLWDGGLEGV